MSFLSQPLQDILIGPSRSFGTADINFKFYITVSETTNDSIEITQQPVQQGAMISDHVFKKPTSFSMQALFNSQLGNLLANNNQSLMDIYNKLLQLQSAFQPFDIVTPKRVYKNMLLQTIGNTTDKKTENCLSITATFQEVIIVNISTIQVPRKNQKNPGKTGATQPAGVKSILATGAGR